MWRSAHSGVLSCLQYPPPGPLMRALWFNERDFSKRNKGNNTTEEPMNTKQWLLGSVAAFVVIAVLEFATAGTNDEL